MSIERLKIGESLPLVYNSFEGDETLYPQAIIRDDTDAIIATVDLAHIGDGVYRNDAQTFPSTTLLSVLYRAYSDSGHTELDPNYEEKIDVFLQADAIPSPNSIQIVERIEATFKQENKMIGRIFTPRLKAQLKDVQLKAMIKQTKIIGIIKQAKITGILREC